MVTILPQQHVIFSLALLNRVTAVPHPFPYSTINRATLLLWPLFIRILINNTRSRFLLVAWLPVWVSHLSGSSFVVVVIAKHTQHRTATLTHSLTPVRLVSPELLHFVSNYHYPLLAKHLSFSLVVSRPRYLAVFLFWYWSPSLSFNPNSNSARFGQRNRADHHVHPC